RGPGGPQEQVTGKHWLVAGQGRIGMSAWPGADAGVRPQGGASRHGCAAAPPRFPEDLEQRQVDLEILAPQLLGRGAFLAGLGVGDVPGGGEIRHIQYGTRTSGASTGKSR